MDPYPCRRQIPWSDLCDPCWKLTVSSFGQLWSLSVPSGTRTCCRRMIWSFSTAEFLLHRWRRCGLGPFIQCRVRHHTGKTNPSLSCGTFSLGRAQEVLAGGFLRPDGLHLCQSLCGDCSLCRPRHVAVSTTSEFFVPDASPTSLGVFEFHRSKDSVQTYACSTIFAAVFFPSQAPA